MRRLWLAIFLLVATTVSAATLVWGPSPVNQSCCDAGDCAGCDGCCPPMGYRVHYGAQSGIYTNTVDVGPSLSWPLPAVWPNGTYYFVAKAYKTLGCADCPGGAPECYPSEFIWRDCESLYSNEAVWVKAGPTGIQPASGGSYQLNWIEEQPMADPVFQGVSNDVAGSFSQVDSLTVTFPSIVSGELVLALVQRNDASACTGVSLGGQAMSKLKENYDFFTVWGVIASSSGTNVNCVASFSNAESWGSMVGGRWSNVNSATALQSSCNASACNALASASTSRTAQQITTTARRLIVGMGSDWDYYSTHTAANGYTKHFDNAIAGGGSSSVQFILSKTADSGNFGGAENFSTSASDQYLSVLLSFEITAGGATINLTETLTFAEALD